MAGSGVTEVTPVEASDIVEEAANEIIEEVKNARSWKV